MATTTGVRFLAAMAVCTGAGVALSAPGEQQIGDPLGAAGDRFGEAIDADGATLVVGARSRDAGGADAGTALVFVRCRGFLVPQAELRPSDPASGARFGRAVAVGGDVVAVGAPGAPGGGAVYVFVRTRGVWAQTQKLTASDASAGDRFGEAVEIAPGGGVGADSRRILVGAPGRDGGTGAILLFLQDDSGWSEAAEIRPDDVVPGEASEEFGAAVATSGSLLAATASGAGKVYVGALQGTQWTEEASFAVSPGGGVPLPWSVAVDDDLLAFGAAGDDARAVNGGSVTLFSRSAGVWTQFATVYAPAPVPNAAFGSSVALRGGVLLAGAPGEGTGGAGAGGTYVFSSRAAGWTFDRRVAAPGAAAGDEFGSAVALTPGGAVVGAPGRSAGTAFAFDALPDQKLVAAVGAANDTFGTSVAIDGDTALLGAPGDDDLAANAGAVHVLVRTGSVWTFQATLTADDGAADDAFGASVALSGDTALVGAESHDAVASNAGAAYVFLRKGTTWERQAKFTAADGVANAFLGRSVALEGDTALVGAAGDDDRGAGSGSAYVLVRTGTAWAQQAKLSAGDGAADDGFGTSVALAGDTAVVGAPGDDDRGAGSGSAYVFVRSGASWTQQAKLLDPDGAASDLFATSVATAGDTALVGAPQDDDDDGTTNSGTVHEFVRSSGNWSRRSRLRAADAATNDLFGGRVVMSADTALVGASGDNLGASTDAGSAYVFVRSAVGWAQHVKLTAADAAASDRYGSAVALAGRTALVGVPRDDEVAAADAGSAWIRALDLPSWNAQSKVTASDGAADDFLGTAVAVSGDTAVVGAPRDDHGGDTDAGSAYVFVRSGTAWAQQAWLKDPEANSTEYFGSAVALEGDTALVGAEFSRVGTEQRGAVHVFVRSGVVWTREAKLQAADAARIDRFGSSVALSGDAALVGAPDDDDRGDSSGSAYVFVRAAGSWTQQAKFVPEDLAADYEFGTSVAIDGGTAVVGAPFDDDRGVSSGSAYVFVRSGDAWVQAAKLTAEDGAAGDLFGFSVAIAGDSLLVGARGDDNLRGNGAGAAYVFVRSGGVWSQRAKLTASDGSNNAAFGISVALSGGTAVVAAPSSSTASIGTAYVFVRSAGGWTEVAKLSDTTGGTDTGFGRSAALSGGTAIVGAEFDDDRASRAGAAHLFEAVPDPAPLAAGAVVPAEWTAGVPLDVALESAGGDGPWQWRVSAGALPSGASVDSPGARIVGPPDESGDFAFTIECNDACVRTAEFAATLHVNESPRIVAAPLPPAAAGRPFEATLARTGGTGDFAWALAGDGGSGLLLDAGTGELSGTPTANGRFPVTVRGSDTLGAFAPDQAFEVVVGDRVDAAAKGRWKEKVPPSAEPTFRTLDALAGSTLDVRVTVPKGAVPPTLLLLDPAGVAVDLGTAVRISKRKVQIRRLSLPRTGRYGLVIQPAGAGAAGDTSVQVVLRPAVRWVESVGLSDGASATLRIAALPGSQVKCKVVAAKGQAVAPRIVSFTDPAGTDVPLGPVAETAKKASFAATVVVGGDSSLVLATRDGTSGEAVVTVTIRPPRGYPFAAED